MYFLLGKELSDVLARQERSRVFLPQGEFALCIYDFQLELSCLWCVIERARGQTQDFSCPLLWSLDPLTTLYPLVASFLCTLSIARSRPDSNQGVDISLIVLVVLFVVAPISLCKQVKSFVCDLLLILSGILFEWTSRVLVVQYRNFGAPSKVQTGNGFVCTQVCTCLCSRKVF